MLRFISSRMSFAKMPTGIPSLRSSTDQEGVNDARRKYYMLERAAAKFGIEICKEFPFKKTEDRPAEEIYEVKIAMVDAKEWIQLKQDIVRVLSSSEMRTEVARLFDRFEGNETAGVKIPVSK